MDLVMNVVNFGKAHLVEVLALVGAVDVILGVVTKFTKATWDDNLYAQFHNLVAKLGKK